MDNDKPYYKPRDLKHDEVLCSFDNGATIIYGDRRIVRDGQEIDKLTFTQYHILGLLVQNGVNRTPTEDLLDLWTYHFSNDESPIYRNAKQAPYNIIAQVNIINIRKKLGKTAISNENRKGYRLESDAIKAALETSSQWYEIRRDHETWHYNALTKELLGTAGLHILSPRMSQIFETVFGIKQYSLSHFSSSAIGIYNVRINTGFLLLAGGNSDDAFTKLSYVSNGYPRKQTDVNCKPCTPPVIDKSTLRIIKGTDLQNTKLGSAASQKLGGTSAAFANAVALPEADYPIAGTRMADYLGMVLQLPKPSNRSNARIDWNYGLCILLAAYAAEVRDGKKYFVPEDAFRSRTGFKADGLGSAHTKLNALLTSAWSQSALPAEKRPYIGASTFKRGLMLIPANNG